MQLKLNRQRNIYIVPTRFGFIFSALVLILLCVGVILNNSSLLFGTALLVMFGLICMYQTHFNVASVELKNFEPASGFASQDVVWKLNFENSAPITSFSLNIFNSIIDVPPNGEFTENINYLLKKRGRNKIKEIKISSTYPLGLFYCWKLCKVESEYFTYPKLLVDSNFEALKFDHIVQAGYEDFLGHKDHLEGESHRHIDWKIHARKDKLLTKLFEVHNPDIELIDWNQLPSISLEEKLSMVATAINRFYKMQKSFSLILPQKIFPPESTETHYKNCLEALSVFEEENV